MPRRDTWEAAVRKKCAKYVEKLEEINGRRRRGRVSPVNPGQVIR